MKAAVKFGLIALVLLALLAFCGSTLFGVTPTIQPRRTPAPEGFNAANFVPLAQLQSTDRFRVINLNTEGDTFYPGLLPDQSVVYISLSKGPYDGYYLFFDAQGRELGRKPRDIKSFPFANTFTDADGYFIVTADSVGETQPYVDVKGGDPISFDQLTGLHGKSDYFRSISYADFPRDSAQYQQQLNTYTFRIDGTWTRARAKRAEGQYLDWKTAPFPDLVTQYNFYGPNANSTRPTYRGEGSFYGGAYTVFQTWFDQQEYLRRRVAPMGSTTGIGRAEHWRGIGYYAVQVGDDSIGFSIPNDRQNLKGSGRVTVRAMGHDTLDFVLIENFDRNKPRYYLIAKTR